MANQQLIKTTDTVSLNSFFRRVIPIFVGMAYLKLSHKITCFKWNSQAVFFNCHILITLTSIGFDSQSNTVNIRRGIIST